MQVPATTNEAVPFETVQMLGVPEVMVTLSPEVAAAAGVYEPPTWAALGAVALNETVCDCFVLAVR